MMVRPTLFKTLLVGSLLLAPAGCQAPVAPAGAAGGASLHVTPRIETGRSLLAIVNRKTQADVGKVHLILSDVTATPAVVASASVPAANLNGIVTFSRLRANTNYQIEAEAYATDMTSRIDQVATPVLINVGTDPMLSPVAIPIRLKDVVFDGTATAEFPIATGAYAPSASAAIAPEEPALVSTQAGSGAQGYAEGAGGLAMFHLPEGLAVASNGDIYVADTSNHRIRRVTSGGVVSLVAGDGNATYLDGLATGTVSFSTPRGMAIDASGTVYIADSGNHRIRRIMNGVVDTLAGSGTVGTGDGTGNLASLSSPHGLTIGPDGNLYFTDWGSNLIRRVTPTGDVTTLAGTADTSGYINGATASATFDEPTGIAVATDGTIYVADTRNHAIRRITGGSVDTFAGATSPNEEGYKDGNGTAARFRSPSGLSLDENGDLVVADTFNRLIRHIRVSDALVKTLAGNQSPGFTDGPARAARFNSPTDLIFHLGELYVVDSRNHRIRKIQFPN